MKNLFIARKVGGVWVCMLKGKAKFESEQAFESVWDCIEFCSEMNGNLTKEKLWKAIANENQTELPL